MVASAKKDLNSTFWPIETLQNLLCLFRFSFWATLSFTLWHRPGHYKGKTLCCSKWKTKKTTWVFFLHKPIKFWRSKSWEQISLFSEVPKMVTHHYRGSPNSISVTMLNFLVQNIAIPCNSEILWLPNSKDTNIMVFRNLGRISTLFEDPLFVQHSVLRSDGEL